MRKLLLFSLFAIVFMASCGSTKELAYLQDLDAIKQSEELSDRYTNVVKPGDMLSIIVSSSKPELAMPYNLFSIRNQMSYLTNRTKLSASGVTFADARVEMEGYTVDAAGNIDFPVLGELRVQGLTRLEVASKIKAILLEQKLPEPVVTVAFINFKITILGEVARPGTYNIVLDRITIFDALGLAGDLTVYGKRDDIMIIRECNGVRETARLNLKSRSIFDSPYYYLQQDDVIVVDPVSARARSISPFVQNIPLFVSLGSLATSVAMVLINVLK